MRDLLITLLVLGALPICMVRPSIGVLLYSWLSYMNPHRLTWGFAYDFPFAQLAAIFTLIGLFVSSEHKKFPLTSMVVVWLLLLAWMGLTTVFALLPDDAWEGLVKVAKIQLMIFVTLYVMGAKEKIIALTWVIALSIGFYGIKGGAFGLITGGKFRVWGPEGSFIADNNALALALIMVIPLMRFLQTTVEKMYLKVGLGVAMFLTGVSVLASQSRGALLGLSTMALFLLLKSKRKVAVAVVLVLLTPIAYQMMPESWHQRMQTIQTYEQDGSAMGRITVWRYTVQVANKRLTGTGFRGIESDVGYKRYARDIYREVMSTHGNFRAAHSIWFGMLGQHGWIGLGLFIVLGVMAWRTGNWIVRAARGRSDLEWCADLASMLQVSMVGYAATGTFLSMEYFDLYFHILAIFVLLGVFVRDQLSVGIAEVEGSGESTRVLVPPAPARGRAENGPDAQPNAT